MFDRGAVLRRRCVHRPRSSERPTLPRHLQAVGPEPRAGHVRRRPRRPPSPRSSRAGPTCGAARRPRSAHRRARGPNVSSARCETTGVTFSDGCRSRSSRRSTSPPARRAGSLENSRPMSIVPSLSACAVSGPPASSAMYSLKCRPYTSSSPLRQSGRCSHSAGPPNVIPGANEVRSLNRSTLRLAAVVAEIANELRSSAGAAPRAVSPRGSSATVELLMRGGGVARGRHPEEAQEAPRVLRDQLHQASLQRRDQQLPRPDVELPLHAEAAGLQRLRVDLGQDLALGEVERADRDGVVVEHARDRVARLTSAREQRQRQAQEQHHRRARPGSTHGCTVSPRAVLVRARRDGAIGGRSRYAGVHADRGRDRATPVAGRAVGGHRRVLRRCASGPSGGVRAHGGGGPGARRPLRRGDVRPASA